jgi:hypothetical protein
MKIFVDVYNGRIKEKTIEVKSEKQLAKIMRELEKEGYKYHGIEIVKHPTPINGEIGICVKMVNEEPIILEFIEDAFKSDKADVEIHKEMVNNE